MATKERTIPAPQPSVEAQPYFDAASQGKLVIKKCTACGQVHHYPRALCPFCGSDRTEWVPASGRGTIYSYSVMRRASPPYAIAYVTLAEGLECPLVTGDARLARAPSIGCTVEVLRA